MSADSPEVPSGCSCICGCGRSLQDLQANLDVVDSLLEDEICRVELVKDVSTATTTEERFVRKTVDVEVLGDSSCAFLLNEAQIISELWTDGENAAAAGIVKLFHAARSKDRLAMLMEYLDGGDLQGLLDSAPKGALPEEMVAVILRQVIEALRHCHARGIAHRDIKAENVLLKRASSASAEGDVTQGLSCRLIDFGLAARLPSGSDAADDSVRPWSMGVGTPDYFAPEMLRTVGPSNTGYGLKVDVWAAGVLAFLLLTGKMPFGSVWDHGGRPTRVNAKIRTFAEPENDTSARQKLLEEAAGEDCWQRLSEAARSFLTSLLAPEQSERPSCVQALQHAWLLTHSGAASFIVTMLPSSSKAEVDGGSPSRGVMRVGGA